MQRKMKFQSLWLFLVAWFIAVNHYTLFTISQPIFNQQETANCSYRSQFELLVQARFPQMPGQAQLLHNPAEARGFILGMNSNKWIKFQRLWQIPAIQDGWARDRLPSVATRAHVQAVTRSACGSLAGPLLLLAGPDLASLHAQSAAAFPRWERKQMVESTLAARDVSPCSPRCLSQYLTCNGK